MAIQAAQQGRNLTIQVLGIEDPFVIVPLPGYAGEWLTETFLQVAARQVKPETLTDVWQAAVDGVDDDGKPIDGPNWTRIRRTLSMTEGESVLHAAFYWQTTLGMDGVNEFIEGGEGLAGSGKALRRLITTLGISPTVIERSTALETLIQKPGLMPRTDPSITSSDDKPMSGFWLNRKQRRAFKKASQQ